MTPIWRCWWWKLGLASWLAMGGAIADSGDCALAQIIPDGTLPNNSIVTPQGNTSLIEGGTQAGSNLFHSFEQFSVPTGGTAYFNNASAIQNIISRVTGSSISNIDGLLRANGTANLFLLNPNGIIFGPNATLAIGGSFLGSTASSLNFADGKQFSATAPQATPLLTVSVPIGLQYGSNAGRVQVQGSGLQVQNGQTLALVGGDVSVEGGEFGFLSAPGGRISLGGLAGTGMVEIEGEQSEGAFRLTELRFPDSVERADVLLTNLAYVNVAASGGGSIAINARNIDISGSSVLRGGLETNSGFLGAQAGDIELSAIEAINIADSDIFNRVGLGAVGNGGDINITTGSLSVTNGAALSASTFGEGNGGSVNIHAGSTVSFDGVGNGSFTGAFSSVQEKALGNGGDINITAVSLALTNGALLGASTFGEGNAGSVNIHAGSTVSFNGSGAFSNVESQGVGKGGDINIQTGSLTLTNGALLVAGTRGKGNAGSVNIHARSTVSLDGMGSNGLSSAALSTVEPKGVGNGGGINITTGLLYVINGAQLSASSEGSGAAGNIEVEASSIRLDNLAFFSSDTTTEQGNIILRSGDLVLRRRSNITTNATGTATGGNITIDTDVIVALENSDISANAGEGQGGNVQINTQGLFLSPDSQITASSERGIDGVVEINTPDVDTSLGLATLPAQLVEASGQLIATGCAALGENEFIVTGRGGLPPSPTDTLSSDTVWTDLRPMTEQAENRPSSESATQPTNSIPEQLVEAQGWVINNLGEVVLTAFAPNVTGRVEGSYYAPPLSVRSGRETFASSSSRCF